MKAPVFAAFAPGVDVSGRMVSAISSSSATSAARERADALRHRLLERPGVEGETPETRAADQRGAAHQHRDPLHGFAARHAGVGLVVERCARSRPGGSWCRS